MTWESFSKYKILSIFLPNVSAVLKVKLSWIACAHKEVPACSLDPEHPFQFFQYGLQGYCYHKEPSFLLPVVITFCASTYFKNNRKKPLSCHILKLNSAFNQLHLAISYLKSEHRRGIFLLLYLNPWHPYLPQCSRLKPATSGQTRCVSAQGWDRIKCPNPEGEIY